MKTDMYRELYETLGDGKELDKMILRQGAADQIRDALDLPVDWSVVGQTDSIATGQKLKYDDKASE